MMSVFLGDIFLVSFLIFAISIVSLFWNRGSLIKSILCVELVFLAATLNLLFASVIKADHHSSGYVMILSILAVAAVEVVIGLALLVVFYRSFGSVGVIDSIMIDNDVDQVS